MVNFCQNTNETFLLLLARQFKYLPSFTSHIKVRCKTQPKIRLKWTIKLATVQHNIHLEGAPRWNQRWQFHDLSMSHNP